MKLQVMMMDAREEGREEGRQEGREEGRQEGREEGREEGRQEGIKKSIANMLRRGKTVDEIVDFCGYEKDYVEQVEKEMLAAAD